MLVGIQMLIEDPDSWWGDAALMGLYDYAMGDEDCQAIFPKHTYLAVMEPYFRHGKDDPNNPTSMRCDNPQHVIKFDTKEEWLRARNELQGFGSQVTVNAQSSQQLCDEGNAHFKRGEFKKAYKLYAEAASAATCDAEKIRAFSNKAMTGIKLEQWEQAVKTAVEVLKLDNVHIKSNYNVSLASLFWQRPEEGEMMCTHLIGGLNININWYEERGYTEEAAADAASLKQATALLADIHRGIDEKRHGIYCLDDMKREAYSTTAGSQEGSAKKLSRKHQDFLSESIELRDCSDRKGSGMFVKADIPAYTLLVACKAFVSSVGKQSQGSISVTTANGQVDTKGRGLELHPIAIRHIIDHPELGEDFYALSAGAAYDGCPLSEEHKRRVDVLRIRATLRANAFSAHVDHGQDSKNQREVLRNSHDASRYAEQMVRGSDKFDNLQHYGESGLWLQSARFNHSCTPNCAYFFIGDFMFIYTTRELRANEEATIIYGPSGGVHTFDETIEYFKDWVGEGDGFRCACPRCAAVQQNNKLKVMENLIYAQHKKAIKWMNKGKQPAACVEKAIASPTRASMRASLEAELNTSFEGAAHTLALLLEMEAHFCFGKNQYMKAYRLCVRQIELLQGVEGRRNGWLIAKLRAAGGAVLVDRAVAAGDDDHPTVGMADAVRHAQEAYDVCCRGDGFKWHWNLDLEDLKLLMRGMMPGDLADMVFARLQT
jgi:tetratricopeptide (TPR) repeat protein